MSAKQWTEAEVHWKTIFREDGAEVLRKFGETSKEDLQAKNEYWHTLLTHALEGFDDTHPAFVAAVMIGERIKQLTSSST